MASSVSSSRCTTSPPHLSQIQPIVAGLVDRVVGAAVDAHPALGDALEHDVLGHVEVDDEVERALAVIVASASAWPTVRGKPSRM